MQVGLLRFLIIYGIDSRPFGNSLYLNNLYFDIILYNINYTYIDIKMSIIIKSD